MFTGYIMHSHLPITLSQFHQQNKYRNRGNQKKKTNHFPEIPEAILKLREKDKERERECECCQCQLMTYSVICQFYLLIVHCHDITSSHRIYQWNTAANSEAADHRCWSSALSRTNQCAFQSFPVKLCSRLLALPVRTRLFFCKWHAVYYFLNLYTVVPSSCQAATDLF